MRYFQIRLSLDSSQAEIMDLLKTSSTEAIQISDGLCVKTTADQKTLMNLLKDLDPVPQVKELSKEEVESDSHATENLKSFMGLTE